MQITIICVLTLIPQRVLEVLCADSFLTSNTVSACRHARCYQHYYYYYIKEDIFGNMLEAFCTSLHLLLILPQGGKEKGTEEVQTTSKELMHAGCKDAPRTLEILVKVVKKHRSTAGNDQTFIYKPIQRQMLGVGAMFWLNQIIDHQQNY